MSEIIELLNYINQSGGIPLTVTTVTEQSSYQFWLTTAVAGFAFIYFGIIIFSKFGIEVFNLIYLSLFKRFNKIKHLMVIKHTTSDLFDMSMINQKTMKDIQQAFMKFKGEDFDLILYTGGGEIFASEFISRLFRKYAGKIRTFVPVYSMSGGTYLALSTDEIYMNDYSCLGATDPQLGSIFKYGSARNWKSIVRYKGKKAEDSTINFKLMGEQYTKTIKRDINELLINKIPDKNQRNEFVNLLTSGEVQHALPLTKENLRSYGLDIKNIDNELNNRLLKLLKFVKEGVTYG